MTVQSEEFRDVPVTRIKVSWEDDEPIAIPDEASIDSKDREPTVIIWKGDRLIESIDNIEFENPGGSYSDPSGEFTPPVASGPKVWVTVDRCSREGDFKYSITATHTAGDQNKADPMIRNQDGGG